MLLPGIYSTSQIRPGRRLIIRILLAPPAKWRIDDAAGLFDLVEGAERLQQHGALLRPVMRLAERVPERPA